MTISFVPPWIGGHLRNVTMEPVAGTMLPFSIWYFPFSCICSYFVSHVYVNACVCVPFLMLPASLLRWYAEVVDGFSPHEPMPSFITRG